MTNTPTNNTDSEKMKLLLNKLEDGTLDRAGARDLKSLLQEEMQGVSKMSRDDLQSLIAVLASMVMNLK